MLRINLHQDGRQSRLELAGKLCGPWVGETERVWRSAEVSSKEIEVDVSILPAQMEIFAPPGMEDLMFQQKSGGRRKVKRMKSPTR